ncbi:MAG: sensor histidine kinase [Deltaproteobacteria bacterium]|nr:sensor histidine kinase [Deltaproteobacteria bacterium]
METFFSTMKPRKLQTKMILLILGLIICIVGVGGLFSLRLISSILEEQMGSRALKVSQAVALIPDIRRDLVKGDLENSSIQSIVEKIRTTTGAQFIVVGDKEGRRYSHPVAERIGQYMVGGDNSPALDEGKAYVSRATGTLGPSIRGKVPVFSAQGDVIGVVSVGYLVQNVNSLIRGYNIKIITFLTAAILFGIAVTIKITDEFKKLIFGLEPSEIAALLQERTTTLETIREGVLAVDEKGLITTVNQAAFETLGLDSGEDVIGRPVISVLPQTRILDVLHTGVSQLDRELLVGDKEIIVNRIPMVNDGKITGVVSSFRNKDELDILAKKLSQIQKYSEMLRVQTHEYSNKLHTISGLIQIGAYQEAVDLIGSETSGYQELIHSLMRIVPDPILAGTVLGKYNKAKELKVDFQIDPDSNMVNVPDTMKREGLVTVLSNILDNSFEAVMENDESRRHVKLSMTDLGNDLIFEIDDSGPGIDKSEWNNVFKRGFTTKKKRGHGMGLFLVEKAITRLQGSVTIGSSELGGAAFTVIIPKTQVMDGANPDSYN